MDNQFEKLLADREKSSTHLPYELKYDASKYSESKPAAGSADLAAIRQQS
jgi:hypothetical protein